MTQTTPKPNPDSYPEELPSLLLPDSPVETDEPMSEVLTVSPLGSDKKKGKTKAIGSERSLKDKAAVAGLLMGLIPLSLLTISAYSISMNLIDRQVRDKIALETDRLSVKLDSFIGGRQGELTTLAGQNNLIDTAIGIGERNNLINRFLKNNPYYDSVTLFNSGGNILATGRNPVPAGDYFQRVNKAGGPVVGEPNKQTNSFNISVPVRDGGGRIVGVLVGRIPLKNLDREFVRTIDRQQEYYYLLDSANRIVASNDNKALGRSLEQEFPRVNSQITANPDNSSSLQETRRGEKTLIGYQKFKGDDGSRWTLAVTRPAAVAFADARWLGIIPLLGMAMAAGVGATAWILADRATRPLRGLSRAVRKIGAGELDTRLEIVGDDEFANLGSNINAMASRLQELVKEQGVSAEQANLLADLSTIRLDGAKMLDNNYSLADEEEAIAPLFNKALEGMRKILDVSRAVVYYFNPDGSGRVIYESVEPGMISALREAFSDPCIPKELLEKYRAGIVATHEDVRAAGFHPDHQQLMTRLQVRANLIVPIRVQEELYGLLIVHERDNPRSWTRKEINFCQRVSEQFSISLDRFRGQIARREDTRRAQLLKDITLKISSTLGSSNVFDLAVEELRKGLMSDRVVVYRFNPDWSGTIIAESVDSRFPAAKGANIMDPCFAERYVDKYRKGRVQATPNIYDAGLTPCHIRELEPFEVKANIVAPVIHQGELLGLLIAHQCSGPRLWQQTEVDFMAQMATQVGLALERTELLERQRQAEEEQRQAREQIQKRALELLMEVDPVSRGDLTIRANVTEDEIGTIADSYNATIENLRKIVTQVQNAAIQLAGTTNYNESAVRALSEDATLQARNIYSALTRIQAMTDSIQAVAANAEQAESAVEQANRTVEAGEVAMNRTVAGIMAIRETVAETAKKVKRLGESSQKISKVVNLIGSFADQTNLLALNASIEAAHAGEEGRGFAVVADEVRSLARQSAAATAEIESLVASIQAETNEVVAAMEAGTEQVVLGTKLVDDTRKSLNQITAVSMQINELVEAIARAAIEQSQTSQAVTETMTEIATISDKTSQEATQVSASFKQLLEVALTLQDSVRQFKVN